MAVENTKFSSLFSPPQVACHLEEMNCQEIFKRLIEVLGQVDHSIDVEHTYEQILTRHSCGITLAYPRVAVVHVRVKGLKQLRVAIATSRT